VDQVCAQPKILGILNVTPDSFSDGGQFAEAKRAIEHFDILLKDGADFVDVGAESTRPGASDVDEREEWHRLAPVLEHAKATGKIDRVSVDTRKFGIMKNAVRMGVGMINNVGAIPEAHQLRELSSQKPKLSFIACHMHGSPESMQNHPIGPASALKRVRAYFESSREDLLSSGFDSNEIYFDPGIGFGKTDAANLALLAETRQLAKNFNIAVGISRKGFISRLLGPVSLGERDAASKALEACSILQGAKIVRTHNVKELKPFLNTWAHFRAEVRA